MLNSQACTATPSCVWCCVYARQVISLPTELYPQLKKEGFETRDYILQGGVCARGVYRVNETVFEKRSLGEPGPSVSTAGRGQC